MDKNFKKMYEEREVKTTAARTQLEEMAADMKSELPKYIDYRVTGVLRLGVVATDTKDNITAFVLGKGTSIANKCIEERIAYGILTKDEVTMSDFEVIRNGNGNYVSKKMYHEIKILEVKEDDIIFGAKSYDVLDIYQTNIVCKELDLLQRFDLK